ncbi:MAG: phospholipase D-like domain-containing protein [Clostridium sp.]
MKYIFCINMIFSVVIVFFQRKDPRTVWTWLLALNFIPVFGILFYLLFSQDFRKNKMFRIKEVEDRLEYSARTQEEIIKNAETALLGTFGSHYADLVLYNLEVSGAVLTMNNKVDIFTDGVEKFDDLKKEMARAKKYIHIQYYIIKNDEVFDSIVPILLEKAKEGVEIRILYDGMGGRFMPKKKWEILKQAGIAIAVFFPPVFGRLNLRVNYRNHRKIAVIDGKVGYVGGFNIGKEYISKDPKFGYWRDTHLKFYGDAVTALQIRFALDWNYAAKENLFKDMRYFSGTERFEYEQSKYEQSKYEQSEYEQSAYEQSTYEQSGSRQPVGVQIIASGPDTSVKQIRDNYLELFHKAGHHIYIQTPYFIPDDAILSALRIAAGRGVDVRLMIPCKPDHPFVYWATYSYVGDLLNAGARCYVYENGFLHAKGVMVDGCVSSYGTANMDIRSFELNFEVNAVIYNEETTERLENIFLEDLSHCREITKQDYEKRGLWIRFKEQCSRLLSPLL